VKKSEIIEKAKQHNIEIIEGNEDEQISFIARQLDVDESELESIFQENDEEEIYGEELNEITYPTSKDSINMNPEISFNENNHLEKQNENNQFNNKYQLEKKDVPNRKGMTNDRTAIAKTKKPNSTKTSSNGGKVSKIVNTAQTVSQLSENPKENGKELVKQQIKHQLKQKVKTAALNVIKKNPYVLLVVLIVALVLLFILMVIGAAEEGGSNSQLYATQYTLNATSITKENFESLMNEACKNHNEYQPYCDNATLIYDISVSNGVSAEAVAVELIINNISFGNNAGDVIFNQTQRISSYKRVNDLISADLANVNYWTNKSTDDNNMCSLISNLETYLGSERFGQITEYCSNDGINCESSNVGGENCEQITDSDKKAIITYGVKKRQFLKESIFGSDWGSTAVYSSTCSIYAQGDKSWRDIPLGNSRLTMGSSGCLVTALAIAISCHDTPVTISEFDAGKFIGQLNSGGCFAPDGGLYWGCTKINDVAPLTKFVSASCVKVTPKCSGGTNWSDQDKQNLINSHLSTGNRFVLVGFIRSHGGQHFVMFSEWIDNSSFKALDPAGGVTSTVYLKDVHRIAAYTYK